MSTFPATQRSLVEALRSNDPAVRERAVDLATRVYRAPVIAVASLQWSMQRADAEDLAHDFLAHAIEKEWFFRYDPARGRFRTFLRSCLQAFASTRREAEGRLKRGGAVRHVAIDNVDLVAEDAPLDALFEREWVRSVLATAVDALRQEAEAAKRQVAFAVFEAHDIDASAHDASVTYAMTAQRFNIPVTQVTNYLNWSRRRFREHVLQTLRALTVSDAEFRDEARTLLGVNVL